MIYVILFLVICYDYSGQMCSPSLAIKDSPQNTSLQLMPGAMLVEQKTGDMLVVDAQGSVSVVYGRTTTMRATLWQAHLNDREPIIPPLSHLLDVGDKNLVVLGITETLVHRRDKMCVCV